MGRSPTSIGEREAKRDVEVGDDGLGLPGQRRAREAPGASHVRKEDVLDDGEIGSERRLLRDHRDAGREPVAGRREAHRPAADPDLARLGHGMAAQDSRQCTFASPVGADQGVDLAGAEHKINALQSLHAAEELVDPARRQRLATCNAAGAGFRPLLQA